MEIFILTVAIIVMLLGLIGAFVPILPGPPLSYAALLIASLSERVEYSLKFLIIWAVVTVIITVADYLIPVAGVKKYGGSRLGVIGSMVGLLAGFMFMPIGLLIGPMLGAFLGELLDGKESSKALKAAFGSFVGFLLGTLMKFSVSLIMLYYLITAIW